MTKRYRNVTRSVTDERDTVEGEQTYEDNDTGWHRFSANWTLLRINEACDRGGITQIMAEADGFGEPGFFPGGYDWSGIRDSTPEAVARMNEIAKQYVTDDDLNALLGLVPA